jgi:hypothetical protein
MMIPFGVWNNFVLVISRIVCYLRDLFILAFPSTTLGSECMCVEYGVVEFRPTELLRYPARLPTWKLLCVSSIRTAWPRLTTLGDRSSHKGKVLVVGC